jgi:glycogen synthase
LWNSAFAYCGALMAVTPNTVFEVSWEVCNKVGGIYQVVRSKAELLKKHYNTYITIGPYFQSQAQFEFQQLATPKEIGEVFAQLESEGIMCLYGKWLIRGEPITILINTQHSRIDINAVKKELWDLYQVDSLFAHGDFDEPLVWAWAAGKLIEKLRSHLPGPVVAHCHEWLAGFALLYLKSRCPEVGSVFTTHATMLGRTMCAVGADLYNILGTFDPLAKSKELGVSEKFTLEKACAQQASVFTTVSQITGVEAEFLFGRKPDVLLLNGLDDSKFPTFEEASILHQKNREKIRDFLEFYFFSHYTFDMDATLIMFVTGRFEYKNKGLDVFTKALGKLNSRLREEGSKKTIVAFFWIPNEVHGIKTNLLEEKGVFNHIKQYVDEHTQDFTRKILRNAPQIREFTCNELLSEEFVRTMQRQVQSMTHAGNPPLVTHNIPAEDQNQMISGFHEAGLFNSKQDPVKVIFYPVYLTGADGLLDLSYNDAVSGCHLGVFPSYYEPWGYTPVEAMAFGVPAISTDLAGFGLFMEPHAGKGTYVLKRNKRSENEVVEDLFNMLLDYSHKDKFARNEEKQQAKALTKLTDWATFITYYFQAHILAVERTQHR